MVDPWDIVGSGRGRGRLPSVQGRCAARNARRWRETARVHL